MVTVIFMQSVMEIALPLKKLSSKNWSNLSGVFKLYSENEKSSFFWKITHLSNEIRVMQNLLHNKSLYDIFSDLHGKDSKTLICNMS
jgi:hypothetical protein